MKNSLFGNINYPVKRINVDKCIFTIGAAIRLIEAIWFIETTRFTKAIWFITTLSGYTRVFT